MGEQINRFLAVRNIVVHAAWNDVDCAIAEKVGNDTGIISFGPFALTGDAHFDGIELSCPNPQSVAWLAAVLPARP